MSSDLPVIVLLLGATVVPWFLYLFASGNRRSRDMDDMQPDRPPMVAPASPARQEEPDGSFRSYALLQLRPDGVVLDWRDEPSALNSPGLSVTTVTDTTALR
jgi:hypothetical protein